MSAPRHSFLPPSMAHQLYGPTRSYAPGYCPVYAPRQPASVSGTTAARSARPQMTAAADPVVPTMPSPLSLAQAA